MPPKNFQASGYGLFCTKVAREQLELIHNRRIPNTELYQMARGLWQDLSDEDKQMWKDKAKEWKTTDEFHEQRKLHKEGYLRRRDENQERFPTKKKPDRKRVGMMAEEDEGRDAIYYDECDYELLRSKRERDRKELLDMFDWQCNGSDQASRRAFIFDRPFYVMSALTYVEEGQNFTPAELAIVRFTLNNGVERKKSHCIAHHFGDDWPNDYLFAQAKSGVDQHRIPIRQTPDVIKKYHLKSDHTHILKTLQHITLASDACPADRFVFVRESEYNRVQGAIYYLKGHAVEEISWDYRVACIEDLYMTIVLYISGQHRTADLKMNDVAMETLTDDVQAQMDTQWENYNRCSKTFCEFHKRSRASVCAQGNAMKNLYNLFEFMAERFGMVVTDDHIPTATLAADDAQPVAIHRSTASGGSGGSAHSGRQQQQHNQKYDNQSNANNNGYYDENHQNQQYEQQQQQHMTQQQQFMTENGAYACGGGTSPSVMVGASINDSLHQSTSAPHINGPINLNEPPPKFQRPKGPTVYTEDNAGGDQMPAALPPQPKVPINIDDDDDPYEAMLRDASEVVIMPVPPSSSSSNLAGQNSAPPFRPTPVNPTNPIIGSQPVINPNSAQSAFKPIHRNNPGLQPRAGFGPASPTYQEQQKQSNTQQQQQQQPYVQQQQQQRPQPSYVQPSQQQKQQPAYGQPPPPYTQQQPQQPYVQQQRPQPSYVQPSQQQPQPQQQQPAYGQPPHPYTQQQQQQQQQLPAHVQPPPPQQQPQQQVPPLQQKQQQQSVDDLLSMTQSSCSVPKRPPSGMGRGRSLVSSTSTNTFTTVTTATPQLEALLEDTKLNGKPVLQQVSSSSTSGGSANPAGWTGPVIGKDVVNDRPLPAAATAAVPPPQPTSPPNKPARRRPNIIPPSVSRPPSTRPGSSASAMNGAARGPTKSGTANAMNNGAAGGSALPNAADFAGPRVAPAFGSTSIPKAILQELNKKQLEYVAKGPKTGFGRGAPPKK